MLTREIRAIFVATVAKCLSDFESAQEIVNYLEDCRRKFADDTEFANIFTVAIDNTQNGSSFVSPQCRKIVGEYLEPIRLAQVNTALVMARQALLQCALTNTTLSSQRNVLEVLKLATVLNSSVTSSATQPIPTSTNHSQQNIGMMSGVSSESILIAEGTSRSEAEKAAVDTTQTPAYNDDVIELFKPQFSQTRGVKK